MVSGWKLYKKRLFLLKATTLGMLFLYLLVRMWLVVNGSIKLNIKVMAQLKGRRLDWSQKGMVKKRV